VARLRRPNTAHEPIWQVELVSDVAVLISGDVDVAVPAAAQSSFTKMWTISPAASSRR
jgi:hypothetical protein